MTDDTLSAGVWETVHAALAKLSMPFPTEALALADAHREEVAPYLVAELESLAAVPSRADEKYMLHEYAMHLLAWWRDPRGLQPLLDFARLRDHKLLDAVFGDLLADGLGRVLGSMARGHLQPLMALADDPHAEPYARGAALDAMCACVIEGDAPREAVLAYVRDLAERAAAESRAVDGEFLFLNFVVSVAAELCAADMLPAIHGWTEEGLLEPALVDLPHIEQTIFQPFEQRLQELRGRGQGYISDPETEMGWWYGLKAPRDQAPPYGQESVQDIDPPPREPAAHAGKTGQFCGASMKDDILSPDVWDAVHAALAKFSKPFPAEALALADAHREEIAPRLVAELESLAADPSRMADDASEYMLLDYAAHLLAWWRDPRGLAPLLALARIPDRDLLDDVFGDYQLSGLGRCLGSMAQGHLQPLMELVEDAQADRFMRGAALGAMKACVIEGDAPRDVVLAYLRDLAPRAADESRIDNDEPAVLNFVVDLAADLCDSDMLPAIRGWFDEGLLDPFLADLEDLEQMAIQPLGQHLQELRERGKGYIRDPETEMGWWHCFQEDPPRDAGLGARAWAPPPREPARIVNLPPPVQQTHVRQSPKIGRNDPCPCGSGKKSKKCHGAA